MVEYDPYAYETHEDPYPVYRALRERSPVYRNDRLGFWALSRYADVRAAFRDAKTFSNRNGVSLDRSTSHAEAEATMSFLAMDAPRHTRMRGLVSRGFTPRRIAELEPALRELARRYLEPLREARAGDFVTELAARLPMDVISEMLGVPPADRDQLRAWADTVVHRDEALEDIPPAAIEAAVNLVGYFSTHVAERRRVPAGDLTGALLSAEIDGDRLSDAEVTGFLFLMIIAGNETTAKLLGNALYWLWRNPAQKQRVWADPSLIPGWIEETLRYDGSTQALARTLTRDVELHGRTMREGERVFLLIGSANRDETVFSNPDRYDITRDTRDMLSFGVGPHFCLGAALARLEARVTLEEMVRSFADYEIDADRAVRVHSVNVRGFASLPIELAPR